jgi:hypothetical protein
MMWLTYRHGPQCVAHLFRTVKPPHGEPYERTLCSYAGYPAATLRPMKSGDRKCKRCIKVFAKYPK